METLYLLGKSIFLLVCSGVVLGATVCLFKFFKAFIDDK